MVEATLATETGAEFRIGSVIKRSFSFLVRRWRLVPVLIAPPFAAAAIVGVTIIWGLSERADPVITGLGLLVFAIAFIDAFSSVGLWAYRDMGGRPASVRASLRTVAGRASGILALNLGMALAVLAIFVPIFLLPYVFLPKDGANDAGLGLFWIVHGVIVFAVSAFWVTKSYCLALPALLAEKLGPREAMRRSARLTEGCGWRIVAIHMLIVAFGYFVGGLASNGLALANDELGSTIGFGFGLATMALTYQVVMAATYRDLREAKDGIPAEGLVEVFD